MNGVKSNNKRAAMFAKFANSIQNVLLIAVVKSG